MVRFCLLVSFSALALAMVVAQYAFEMHLPTTIMDPTGQLIGALELICLVASVGGILWGRS